MIFGLRAYQRSDRVICPDRHDPVAANGDGLDQPVVRVNGDHVGANDLIGHRGLRAKSREQRSELARIMTKRIKDKDMKL